VFSDQLSGYVFDVFDSGHQKHNCYVWDEKQGTHKHLIRGNRGPDEVLSILDQHTKRMIPDENGGALVLFSDNCKGQNKNQVRLYNSISIH
jgi:hypothetical protein